MEIIKSKQNKGYLGGISLLLHYGCDCVKNIGEWHEDKSFQSSVTRCDCVKGTGEGLHEE